MRMLAIGNAILLVAMLPGLRGAAVPAHAADPAPASPAPASPPLAANDRLDDLITQIVRDQVPPEYEERRNWGQTTTVWSGVRVWIEDGQLETKRRQQRVNHGRWQLYRFRLVDPDRRFHVHVENLREVAPGRAAFDLWGEAQLAVMARVSEWQRGVQLFSVSANALATVRLRTTCEVGLKLEPGKLIPDVQLDPAVTAARLELVAFRLQRISQLHGPLVKELGDAIRGIVADRLADQQPKLVDKINRQLQKHRDAWRLSLQDVLADQ